MLNKRILTLSGTEFENLCFSLMQRMGFSVEKTKTTGDGGIDLIAYSGDSFFKGKYIVQCKRYNGSVGVQIVRDLFGVVSAEHANKGIIITTGYFTVSAVEFAKEKNIELIDAEQLEVLLNDAGLINLENEKEYFFYNSPDFDKAKYDYYKDIISRDLHSKGICQSFLFEFLFQYFENTNADMMERHSQIAHNGLAEEYLHLFDWYAKKYHSRGEKEKKILPYYIRKYKGIAQLYNFDIFDYIQSRYELLTRDYWFEIWTNLHSEKGSYFKLHEMTQNDVKQIWMYVITRQWDKIRYRCNYSYYEILNIYALCKYFSIDSGIRYIKEKNYSKQSPLHYAQCVSVFQNAPYFRVATEEGRIFSPQIEILNGYWGIARFVPSEKHITITPKYSYENTIEIRAYFDHYADRHRDKIESEVKRINALFSSLEN